MTADELAIEIHRRQGYLVLGAYRLMKVGEIVPQPDSAIGLTTIPLRITGKATFALFMLQNQLVEAITSEKTLRKFSEPSNFYLVEAMD